MSATGRGGEYSKLAAYYTPLPLARFLLGLLPIWDRPQRFLEPHAGSGSFLAAALELEARHGVYHRLNALDIDPTAQGIALARSEGGWGVVGDFLTTALPSRPDVIAGNPPYSIPQPEEACSTCGGTGKVWRDAGRDGWYRDPQTDRWYRTCTRCKGGGRWRPKPAAVAHPHIRRALEVVAPGGHVAFLLRLGILEGRERFPFWKELPPRKVWALSTRPKFTGTGSDQTSYGWFWWQQGHTGPTELDVVDWSAK